MLIINDLWLKHSIKDIDGWYVGVHPKTFRVWFINFWDRSYGFKQEIEFENNRNAEVYNLHRRGDEDYMVTYP